MVGMFLAVTKWKKLKIKNSNIQISGVVIAIIASQQ
jgi:hypothetical protein